ncbi:glycoside hydrolase family 38 C-terminal domain-containing protein [Allorhizocola rhizosphaerae]|uniref:glycoside hydrolase family 38 N-terminal domain-containing protein n=1 Tax=Allorhizocola rhizosphaerae TaxID=1872709 RepID=UPI000E3B7F89|nr:glycoside hydrolase family 38 C-terminal domain-containing protein [Allorhizocola rhizosphaerae]
MNVWLVPHTHWDREWYEPFQRFRLRLVDLIDDVIARAEGDPSFHFTLDGQLAVVDDYLEVRPDARDRIASLVASGQFAIGPWAILLDEFLCSGENIVRNLEWGLRRAASFGGAMPVGYLPDMFGHCAQMPQILAGVGIPMACVWRGVPARIDRHAFVWAAPDGTALRTEYLPGGYGNAAELLERGDLGGHLEWARPWFGDDPVLAMYGTDHSAPLPTLKQAVARLGGRVRLSTLAQYLALFDPSDVEALPVWRGEMRSHARANILPGVISNRPHLKRALGAAERMVERYAEPLAALWSPASLWPERLLELAWQRLVQSSCHDSVTGCGVDETAVQVEARIAEAEQIGRGVRDRALAGLAGLVPAQATLVFNPSPWERTSVVALEVAASVDGPVALQLPDGSVVPAQEVGRNTGPLYETARPAGWIAAGLRKGTLGLEFLGRTVQSVQITGERELTVTVGRIGGGLTPDLAPHVTGGDWTMRVLEEPVRTVYAQLTVPPLGYTSVRAVPLTVVESAGQRLDNGLLSVEVVPDGTLTLWAVDGTVLRGVGRIVDQEDLGDLYNCAPGPAKPLTGEVSIDVVESGPLVQALTVRGAVDMRVELRAGEPFVRLEVSYTNRQPDHRLRLHVPLARPAPVSHAEGQFAVVQRGLTSEGGHGEMPLPTFPAYSFVDAGGAAVLLDQVTEYELADGELALTLLRATGFISRAEHPLRAEPAGPVIATPQAQLIDAQIRTRLAILPHAGSWAEAGVARWAEVFRCPLVSERGLAAGGTLSAAAGVSVAGDGVVLTSLRRRDADWLELRVVAMTDEPTTARLGGVTAARRADLLGRPGEPLPGLTMRLRAWEIATVQVMR